MSVANVTVRKPDDWEGITMERDEQLRQIARAGKQWKRILGRRIDMEGTCCVLPFLFWNYTDSTNSVRLSTVFGVCATLGG